MQRAGAAPSDRLPHVTCVMTAHDYERYVGGALRSVLEQEYPEELLDVVVVDDGSSDATAEVVRAVARGAEGRVRLVSQANAGLAAATNTALAHAGGELVAICDADDEWLPGKVRAQVELMLARPEVVLAYADMRLIDADGAQIDASLLSRAGVTPLRGHVLDALIRRNFTTNSTLMLRARCVVPIPPESPYADYWLALHAAAAGELDFIERALASYRLHTSNMSLGTSGERRVADLRRELAIRRLVLLGQLFESVGTDALVELYGDFEARARELVQAAGTVIVEPFTLAPGERERAAAELARALAAGEGEPALRCCLRAWLLDPYSREARAHLRGLLALRAERSRPPGRGAQVTLVEADELIAAPELARKYCEAVREQDGAKLVIVTGAELEVTAARLRGALRGAGVDPDAGPDMVLVPREAAAGITPDAVLARAGTRRLAEPAPGASAS